MPKISGVDLAKEIRLHNIETPIIFITGYKSQIHQKELDELNIQQLLKKPFTFQDINQAIINHLETGI